MAPKRPNAKAVAGNEKKAAHAAQVAAKDAAAMEADNAKNWEQGANMRGKSRANDAATKADEANRKRLEKAAMLAAEEAELGPGGKIKASVGVKKKGGKKKNDLGLLEDALVGAADKKTKAKKLAEKQKKERLEKEAKARAEKAQQEAAALDPLLQNTNAMLEGAAGREGNLQAMEGASGLDGALETLNISGGMEVKSHRALHMAFEERMLPIMKEDYPGLRLTQYKEKIFALWKKSSENPHNQPLPESS
jgi:hypothetical protein